MFTCMQNKSMHGCNSTACRKFKFKFKVYAFESEKQNFLNCDLKHEGEGAKVNFYEDACKLLLFHWKLVSRKDWFLSSHHLIKRLFLKKEGIPVSRCAVARSRSRTFSLTCKQIYADVSMLAHTTFRYKLAYVLDIRLHNDLE